MRTLTATTRQRWAALSAGGRLWWTAMATLGIATAVLVGVATVGDSMAGARGTTAAKSSAPATTAPSAMGHMGHTSTGNGVGSSGAGSTPAVTQTSSICPNVHGTVMGDGMLMAPVPSGAPTAAQQAAANQLVAATTQGIAKYANLQTAEAAGYVPITNPDAHLVHYADWEAVRSGDVLDPQRPSSLVFANTVNGPVLLGAMYLGPGPCRPGPDVGGPLTQWHAHTNLCLSATHQVVGRTDASGICSSGRHNTSTFFMLHVWTEPSLASTQQFQADLSRSSLVPIILGKA